MLIRAMQQPALGSPVPDWVGVRQVAKSWGVTPDAVMASSSYWVTRELMFMQAESFVQNDAARKTG